LEPRIVVAETDEDALLMLVPEVHREVARTRLALVKANAYEAGVAMVVETVKELAVGL
jgi:alanine racemase